jgi:hypothetical protein
MAQEQETPREQLSDSQLQTLAYFAIGVASEGSMAGRNVAYKLSFAGSIGNGIMRPVGNSGFSIGTLQTDLGQHPQVATGLVDAYQAWAVQQTPSVALSPQEREQIIHDLQRDGNAIRAEGGRAPDATIQANLNHFLASDDGIGFVHERDRAQVTHLMRAGDDQQDPGGALHQLRQTDLYANASLADQARLATMLMKLENQAGRGRYPGVIQSICDGSLQSADDVKERIDGMMRNRIVNGEERPDYIESGVEHALHGTEVFNLLRESDAASPLRAVFDAVSADPLANPAMLRNDRIPRDAAHHYDTVKTLFLQNIDSPDFIRALDRGGAHAWGRPQPEGGQHVTAGLYASGDDFVVWNRDGKGHACIDGAWSDVPRTDLTRIRNRDGAIDLDRTRSDGSTTRLLHVDPRQPPLRAVLGDGRQRPVEQYERVQTLGANDPLLRQADSAMRRLDQSMGREFDDFSACMAASAACLARRSGLTGIDHIVLSTDSGRVRSGENMFVVQGDLRDPAHHRAWMRTDEAVRMPVTQSLEELEQLAQTRQQQEQVLDNPQRHMQGPVRS